LRPSLEDIYRVPRHQYIRNFAELMDVPISPSPTLTIRESPQRVLGKKQFGT
jgi:hypothetical protein